MSFRILNQAPQYLLADGSVNAGGKLWFYETDLTTPQNTWSDEALSVLNSNPVIMDAAGRTLTDVWGADAEYGVVMTDAADVVIWTRNNVRASEAAALTIPALVDGQFLTNNGSVLLWGPVLQVPDPTGHADDILYSDGSLAFWAAAPEAPVAPDPEIVVAAGSFQAGISTDTTKFKVLFGTGSAPSTGSKSTSLPVVFGVAFTTTPVVFIQPTNGNASNVFVKSVAASVGVAGFTAEFSTLTGGSSADGFSTSNINAAIGFAWAAFGTVTVA